MGQYSNDPLTDARIKRSHDKWVTDDTEWQRRVAHEEDEEEPTEGIKENLEEIPSNVDLEKEIDEWLKAGPITDTRYDDYCDDDIQATARHFYELGLNARKNK